MKTIQTDSEVLLSSGIDYHKHDNVVRLIDGDGRAIRSPSIKRLFDDRGRAQSTKVRAAELTFTWYNEPGETLHITQKR